MTQVQLAQFPNATLPTTFSAFIAEWAKVCDPAGPITLGELAIRIEVPVGTLRDYVKGVSHPRKSRVVALEQKLGLSLEQFYDAPKKEKDPILVNGQLCTPKEKETVKMRPGKPPVMTVSKEQAEKLQQPQGCPVCDNRKATKTHFADGSPRPAGVSGRLPADRTLVVSHEEPTLPSKEAMQALEGGIWPNKPAANVKTPDANFSDDDKLKSVIARRRALGLTAERFAKLAGLLTGGWSRVERGVPFKDRRKFIRVALKTLDKLEAKAGTIKPTLAQANRYATQTQLESFANYLGSLLDQSGHDVISFTYAEFYTHLNTQTGAKTCEAATLASVLLDRTVNGRGSYLMMAGNNAVIIARDANFASVA